MNAKLQTIEQAGASIESITKVVNFQLKYDVVESKSSAILLPGFQIIDIGYVADGTYQVVLIGKLQVGEKDFSSKEISRDGRFIAYDNVTVLDTRTNLMWAAKDNGGNINWANARTIVKIIAAVVIQAGGCRHRMNWRGYMIRLYLINLNVDIIFI